MEHHANLTHWDDVEASQRSVGELSARRRVLAAAAGAREIGLSRWEIAPGARSTPAHVHADEEEIFFVLGGSGLSWQDGTTYEVRAGDCLVHRVNEEAHTLLAGPDGLDVLAFAEGSRTNITWLPRTQTFWLGARWVPADSPHPFTADAAAGPISRPEPSSPRPATIVALEDVAPAVYEDEGYRGSERKLSAAAGAVSSGLRHVLLEPGSLSCPPHVHSSEEELFVVLDGAGVAWLGDERLALRAGAVLVRPAGTGVAHAIEAGPGGLTFLAYGQNRANEAVYYPRSDKLLIGGVMMRVERADYFDGERPADLA